jgi:predicted DNA-binding ribbon-helix-helix protein
MVSKRVRRKGRNGKTVTLSRRRAGTSNTKLPVAALRNRAVTRQNPPLKSLRKVATAAECGMTATALIEALDRLRLAENPDRSLSSALRIYITKYFYGQSERYGFYDPDSRWAFRISRPSKSEMAEEALRANPGKSDRVVAREIGISRNTVRNVRMKLARVDQLRGGS